MDTSLPAWLAPTTNEPTTTAPTVPTRRGRNNAVTQLEQTQFELAFDRILCEFRKGRFLSSVVRDDPRGLDYGRLLNWIFKDSERTTEYFEAQQISAEMIVARTMDPELAAQQQLPEDAQWAKLEFEKAKWYAGIVNKKRYAVTQQIEINQNISILKAMEDATKRVIEGKVIEVEDEP